jgi:hypothetical protein
MQRIWIPITRIVDYPRDNFRSLPAEIGSTAPLARIVLPRRFVFPREVTSTNACSPVLPPLITALDEVVG